MDRAAPVIVLASVILCLVASAGYVALMMPFYLPDVFASRMIDVNGWMLDRLPNGALDAVIPGPGCVAFWTLLVACSVSLIAGLRAWRVGPATRRCIAMTACGIVLGTVLAGGPFWFRTFARASVDHTQAASRQTMERIRQKIESGRIAGPDDVGLTDGRSAAIVDLSRLRSRGRPVPPLP